MEEEPVELIRETQRNQLFLDRKKLKDKETDIRRSLANFRISKEDVISIINKLKTKSSISESELKTLQNAIVDDVNIIELVLNTHGTLRGLVRELSGKDVHKQCAACGCLCNLALSDCKGSCVVGKAAGAYLIAALDSLSVQLAVNCAWTLGNLAASSSKCCELLLAAGCIKLCDVSTHDDVTHAAVYALTHVAYVMKDDLKPEHLQRILQYLSKIQITIESARLLFILSCHKDFSYELIPETHLQKVVEKIPVSMKNHLNNCKNNNLNEPKTKCCELIFLFRILANICNEKFYNNLLGYFLENNLVGYFKLLLKDDDESVWWFLGNVLNMCGENVFFHELIND